MYMINPFSIDESSVALTSNGDLYVWGRNTDNFMGLGKNRISIIEPTRVRILLSLISISI
jgi:alpha-tubulin suppressor-like RCC1 family protein